MATLAQNQTAEQTALSVFNFQSNDVNVVTDDKGEPWFLANDVCSVLGYANPRQAIIKNCRQGGVSKRDTPTKSGIQEMTWINEGNLYRLIIKSRKPEAEPFEAWVCDEVLPSIRKTGSYQLPEFAKDPHLAVKNAVLELAGKYNVSYGAVYKRLYNKFQVRTYTAIVPEYCQAAIEYIKSLEGEYIPRDKIAAPKPSLALCDGQHYVVAKDGEVLLHKVLSHDVNDSFLKQNSVDTLLIDIPREATRHNNTMMPNLHTLSTLYDGYGFNGNPLVGLFATLTQAQKEGKPVMIKDVAGARLIYDMTEALARQYSNARAYSLVAST